MLNNNEVVLDYGHGDSDSGACEGNFKEKVWNYDTGKSCKKELEKYGVIVHETRKGDEYVSLNERCRIANRTNAKWFVSIHHNAGGGDRGEVIHSILEGDGKLLAQDISKELNVVGQSTVKVYDKKGNGNKDYYAVIRGTKMNSVIVEVCFMDNVTDRQIADTKAERERNGIAIAHGILRRMGITPVENNSSNNISEGFKKGSYSGRKAKVTVSELNVRYDRWVNGVAEPSKVGVLKKGQIVSLEWCENGWISIQGYKGRKGLGYVNSKYLQLI